MQQSRRLAVSMVCGGIATFADLYAIQAVLPALSDQMHINESVASLAISVATGALALTVLPWAAVADRIGRARAMKIATIIAAITGLLAPFAPTIAILLILRALSGAALAAVPALAMAHLVEHAVPGRSVAMGGLYIAGTSVGGLIGRILTGTVAGIVGGANGWRWGLAATAIAVVVLAVIFAVSLPKDSLPNEASPRKAPPRLTRGQRHTSNHTHTDAGGAPPRQQRRIHQAMRGSAVWSLYLQGFLLMGGFVTMYNLLAFRLLAPPYLVPASLVSLLFVIYLVGTASSSLVGRLVGRFGRRRIVMAGGGGVAAGALLTLAHPLALIIAGLIVVTFSFFLAHAVAAAWVGVLVPSARSQATALYSLTYYLGSSVVGYVGALVFMHSGWSGAAGMVAMAAVIAVAIAAKAAPREPFKRV
ncbi:MAG: MFS transporter [Nakamurella sp.]